MLSILELNDDVLNKIFANLSFLDVCNINQTSSRFNTVAHYSLNRRYSNFHFDFVKEFGTYVSPIVTSGNFDSYSRLISPHIKTLILAPDQEMPREILWYHNPMRISNFYHFERFLAILLKHQKQLQTIEMHDTTYQIFLKYNTSRQTNSQQQKKQLSIYGIFINDQQIQYIFNNWPFDELIYSDQHKCNHQEFCEEIECVYRHVEFNKQSRNIIERDTIKTHLGNLFTTISGIHSLTIRNTHISDLKCAHQKLDKVQSYDPVMRPKKMKKLSPSDLMLISKLANLKIVKLINCTDVCNKFICKLAETAKIEELTYSFSGLQIMKNIFYDDRYLYKFTFTTLRKLSTSYAIQNPMLLEIANLNKSLKYIRFLITLFTCDVMAEFIGLATELKCIRFDFNGYSFDILKMLLEMFQQIDNTTLSDRPKLEIILGENLSEYWELDIQIRKEYDLKFKQLNNIVVTDVYSDLYILKNITKLIL